LSVAMVRHRVMPVIRLGGQFGRLNVVLWRIATSHSASIGGYMVLDRLRMQYGRVWAVYGHRVCQRIGYAMKTS
jgi:hypothetical protein